MHKLILIIEKDEVGYQGRVTYDDNLIFDEADDIPSLEKKLKAALTEFHDLNPNEVEFEYQYDLTAFFEKFHYLKISSVAEVAGLNASLLRQYVNGIKHPSFTQAQKIENAIQRIAAELTGLQIYANPS